MSEPIDTLDLFAGPGGWSVAAAALGLTERGIEWDDAACATARAAGFDRLQADVSALDPYTAWRAACDGVERALRLLIASAPCQAFSTAGKGKGRKGAPIILDGVAQIAAGRDPVVVCKEVDAALDDPRAALVLEPLRWALDLEPEAIALEQVPAVLPLWQAIAEVLRDDGYSVWTGNVTAEQYDTPQTRRRALLLASRTRRIDGPPPPVRRRFRKGVAQHEALDLLDAELLPWLSMADALGWHDDDLVGFARRADRGDTVTIDGDDYRARDLRSADSPAFALTEKARSWTRYLRNGNQANSAERYLDEPAPTITASHDTADRVWLTRELEAGRWALRSHQTVAGGDYAQRGIHEPALTIKTQGTPRSGKWIRQPSSMSGAGATAPQTAGQVPRDLVEPAHTITGGGTAWWHGDTVDGQPRINDQSGKSRNDGIRVTVEEAATLQGFPDGYPWQGSQTARYRQVGDAVPPPLAAHALAHVLGIDLGGSLYAEASTPTGGKPA